MFVNPPRNVSTFGFRKWVEKVSKYLTYFHPTGALLPQSMADSAAPNSSVYYSTTAGKLVYKDSSGIVNNLY